MAMAEQPDKSAAITARKLTRADIWPAAADALARAFYDDPLDVYLIPDGEKRRRVLPYFFRGTLRLAMPEDCIYTTEGEARGAALFLPPGKTNPPLTRVIREMVPQLPRFGMGAALRMMGALDELEKHHPKEDHWYLFILGVDPLSQGQGLGSALMSPILAEADKSGLPVYLETQEPSNVPYYQKHGFEVAENWKLQKGKGPENWTMLRKHRS